MLFSLDELKKKDKEKSTESPYLTRVRGFSAETHPKALVEETLSPAEKHLKKEKKLKQESTHP